MALRAAGLCRLRDQSASGGPVPGTARHVGAKSDKADAHTMTDMVRADAGQLWPVAGDSAGAGAIKVAARRTRR